MKYTFEKKTYLIPDDVVDNYVDKYDISIAEACEMYLADNDKIKSKEEEELTNKAAKNAVTQTIHKARGEKKDRKPREKKENPLKKEIIQTIFEAIANNLIDKSKIVVENAEKYINFTIDDRDFTINLVEHRTKKWDK